MAEHKHAAVLRAIADGKDVQLRTALQGVWIDFDVDSHINPITSGINAEWRIKPEPKPDVVRYVNVYSTTGIGDLCESDIEAEVYRSRTFYPASGKLRLTFSDNEGAYKLKSAEVLP